MKISILLLFLIPLSLFAQSKIDTSEYVWSEINSPENLFVDNSKYTAICIYDDEIYLSSLRGITSSLFVYKNNKLTVLNDSVTDSEIKNIFVDKKFIILESYSKILISHDNGKTWKNLIDEKSKYRYCHELFYNNKSIFLAQSSYLLKSDNYGKSWDTVYNDFLHHFVADKKNIMAICKDSLLLSKDNGQTWTAINDFSKYSFSIIDKAIYNKTGYILLIQNRMNSPFQTYTDDPTYILIHFEKPDILENSLKTDTTNYFNTFEGVSVTSLNNNIFVSTKEGLFATKDMGITWEVVNRSPALHSAKIYTKNNDLIAFNYYAIFISKDEGKSWNHLPNTITKNYYDNASYGYTFKPITINDVISSGDTLYAATNWGLFHSINNGKSWIITSSDLLNCRINSIIKVDNTILGGVISNASYMNFKYDITNSTTTINNHPYLDNITNYNDTLLASSHRGGYYSIDRGVNWEKIYDKDLSNLFIVKDTLIAIKHYTRVDTSPDFGKTWNKVNFNGFIGSVAFIKDTAYIALGFNNEYKFYNSIHNIEELNFNFYKNRDGDWIFGPPQEIISHNESLFIITSFGFDQPDFVRGYIFTSNDNGITWKQMHKNDMFFRSININDDYLYAQEFNGKLYKIKLK